MPADPRRHRDRIAVVGRGIRGLAAAAFLRRAGLAATVYEQASALGEVGAGLVVARYERVRSPRAGRVQEASRGRIAHHHLPDGPEQVARDAAFAGEDPLSHNDWLYGYDAEQAAAAAAPAG